MNTRNKAPGTKAPLPILEVPSAEAGGVLPHDKWNEPLTVIVPSSEFIVKGSVIKLIVNSGLFAEQTVTTGGAGDPAFTFSIDDSNFPSGDPLSRVNLGYSVKYPESQEVTPSPYTFELIFDKQAPGGKPLPYLGFDDNQLLGIYPDSFDKEDYLNVKLAPWSDKAVGDTLTPWLGKEEPDSENPSAGWLAGETITVTDPAELGKSIQVKFPKAALEALGDVPQHFGFKLKDRLGNESQVSPTREIAVHLNDKAHRPTNWRTKGKVSVVRKEPRALAEAKILSPEVRKTDGRVKVADLTKPIVLKITAPEINYQTSTAQLYINGYALENAYGDPIFPVAGQDFELSIAAADFPDPVYPAVVWKVDYRYYDLESDNGEFSKKPIQLIFDEFSPAGDEPPAPIAVPDKLISDGVSIGDIVKFPEGPEGLPLHVAAWFDEDLGDQIELWLGTDKTEASGAYLSTLPPVLADIGGGVDVVFPLADLNPFTSNPVYFGYRVTDWAGNVSKLSSLVPLKLYLNDQPSSLLAPLIPEAEPYNPADGNNTPPGTGMLVWTEANTTTTVQIPTYTNVKAGDRIYVQWGAQGVEPVSVTQGDIDTAGTNGYLLLLEVDFITTVQPVGSNPNLAVSYTVRRTGSPDQSSPDQYIQVNLVTPGGPAPDPTPGTPEHDNMKPLEVMSSVAGSTLNLITPEGYDKTATITIHRGGVDNRPIWLVGDTLTVYWGAPEDDPAPVTITLDNETSDILIHLPAEFIAKNGTGLIPVYYTLTRDLGNGNLVTALAVTTTVTVQSPAEAPGGIGPLLKAFFPEQQPPTIFNPYHRITHDAGTRGTTLQIPLLNAGGAPLANVAVGDTITGEFYGVDDPASGNGADADPNKPKIDLSVIPIDHKINEGDLTKGYYEVAVPYSRTCYICRNLSVTKYSIRNAAGIIKMAPDEYILFAINPVGGTCPIPEKR